MGMIIWDLREYGGGGSYVGKMSIFQPEHVRLVEAALSNGPEDGMTGKQVWDAVDRAVPEDTVHLILGEMAHRGLVDRTSTPRGGRRKAVRRASDATAMSIIGTCMSAFPRSTRRQPAATL